MSLAAVRTDLVEALEATGYTIHPSPPEQVSPPCVIIQPAEPYLVAPTVDLFGGLAEWRVNLELYVLVDHVSNAAADAALNTALEAVLPAAQAAGYGVGDIGKPQVYLAISGDWAAYGALIPLHTTVTL